MFRHSSPLTLHGHNLRIKPRILKTNKIQKRKVVQCRKKRLDVSVGITGESASEEGGGREGGGEKEVEEEVVVVGGIRLTPEAAVALSQSHSVSTCRTRASVTSEPIAGRLAAPDPGFTLSPWQHHCRESTIACMRTAGQVSLHPPILCCYSIWSTLLWSWNTVI